MRVPSLRELTLRMRFALAFVCERMALLAKNFFKGTKVGFKAEIKVEEKEEVEPFDSAKSLAAPPLVSFCAPRWLYGLNSQKLSGARIRDC